MDYYGTRLATCSSDRVIKIFEVKSNNQSYPVAELTGYVAVVSFCWDRVTEMTDEARCFVTDMKGQYGKLHGRTLCMKTCWHPALMTTRSSFGKKPITNGPKLTSTLNTKPPVNSLRHLFCMCYESILSLFQWIRFVGPHTSLDACWFVAALTNQYPYSAT